ncbi:helix-turn-helix transcriptional regulator [Bacillus thermotolerans]|uniref:ADA regulatory protein n=1 Tax=Bacillus thermotolerans TaxID=1221996 RepID=A0A0F5HPS9_BACTR|nr:AraC family transcriptional regulator [Bacillus thermotolerans]KKB35326.1 ADA regulatory protein [Bacillus thermotolerans]
MERVNDITCEKRTYSREFISHEHDFGQLLFPLQGSLDIQTERQEIKLDPDHCFYLPPKLVHHYRSVDRNEFLILDIPMHYLPEDTSSMYTQLDQQWASIRYLLLEEAKSQEGAAALADLTRYITNKLHRSTAPSIDYIHKHFREPIRLETLASLEHYHPAYYSAWFKKKTGKSPKVYISELRLKEAKHLLLSTGWSMSRISEELGFENSSSFTRWFVRWEGTSPQKYRILNNG